MRQGRNPTRKQKEWIAGHKSGKGTLNPKNWLVCQVTDEKMIVMHKDTGKKKELLLHKKG
ncbi:DUF6906 family protein [Enterococcus sp. 5B3_DIV0040]|uniref:DUF6906 family protein n=1 Tax=Enterococcus sp. 5B3_DIV0040 TaxID=1834182 RepID=UPI000A359697|nr:hypothetical protein [Enterococcus sp. 5B3_DIV0040]OTO02263.1 hypothetical protein A5883_003090 [Enterococcus sp. 5B3_DIV0040]